NDNLSDAPEASFGCQGGEADELRHTMRRELAAKNTAASKTMSIDDINKFKALKTRNNQFRAKFHRTIFLLGSLDGTEK
ncbi:MAG: hypothetical protein K7J15_01520, partial [Candidatus Regiella insecticola]|nr:hypothetical protein [Candidatus Regiella insecticola]